MKTSENRLEEIYLHVGLHKTGTTSIQQTLYLEKNRKILEKHDVLYPEYWDPNHSIPIYSVFCDNPEEYHINIRNNYSVQEIANINENFLFRLEEELVEKQPSRLIISGEDISLLPIHNLEELKTYFNAKFTEKIKIRVIVYVREPLSWMVSAIQETIKGGNNYETTMNEMVNAIKEFPKKHVEKFAQVFGKDNVYVYSFENAVTHKYGLVGHFLSVIGINHNKLRKFKMVRFNESISLVAGDILSFINKEAPLIVAGKLNEKRINGDTKPLFKISGPKFDLPYNDKKRLLENELHGVKWLNDHFGVSYPVTKKINKYEFDGMLSEESIKDIKTAYPKLTITLRDLVMKYVQNKIISSTSNVNKLLFEKLLGELEELNRGEYRFIKTLGIEDNIDPAVVYREVALFMEYNNLIGSAKVMMKKALELRPNGPFILEKCKQYDKLLASKKKK